MSFFDNLGHSIENGIFFEGWYYKISFNDYQNTLVVIPGVYMNDDNRHAFIMVAYENTSHYYRFPFESFSSSTDEYIVKIDHDRNVFSYDKLLLDLEPKDGDDATESFRMNLTLSSHAFIPDLSVIAPGTMGPYSWIPTMQCYHHVLSMKYQIDGSFGNVTTSAVGYLEKDWGNSFPSIWIWGQANQWENLPSTSSASLFFSLALIPWYFNLEFAGFLIVFEHNNQFYRFNTYLQSVVNDLSVDKNTNQVSFNIYDLLFEYKLHVSTHLDGHESIKGAPLYGPRNGRMEKFVQEILAKNVYFDVQLSKLIQNSTTTPNKDADDPFVQHGYSEEIIFQGRAQNVALEIEGNVNWLVEKFRQTYENIYPWNFSLIRSLFHYYKSFFSN